VASTPPLSDSWTPTTLAGAPSPRAYTSAVWTGARALVWGGQNTSNDLDLDTGGAYDPTADSWTPTTLTGAPSARIWHAAVWSDQEMLVWGGCNGPANCNLELLDGSRYDPALDLWIEMTTQSAPGARRSHCGVWTGTSLIVWGGYTGSYSSYTSTGGVYKPRPNILFSDDFESGDFSVWNGKMQ
jgi:N-acetylneuraminic acid mutarotase